MDINTITADKAREILTKQYPPLKHNWVFDRKLLLLPDKQAESILMSVTPQKIALAMALLKATEIKNIEEKKEQLFKILEKPETYNQQFKDQAFDCDDFGLVTNAFVKLKVAELNLPYNWAFAESSLVIPGRGIHNKNIYIRENYSLILYEPQNQEFTLPNGEIVFYTRM